MKASNGCRVLMLLENNPYPQDSRVHNEARALTSAGYAVSVIAPKSKGQPWQDVLDHVHVYRYPGLPDGNGLLSYVLEYGYSMVATFILSIIVALRGGFDIIHTHNPPDTFVFFVVLYKLLGKRFVFDQHDLSPEMYRARSDGGGSSLVYNTLLWIERVSYRFANHIIATNESYKTIAMQRGNLPEDRITIVRNGPDLNQFRPGESARNPNETRTLIGYAGIIGIQDGVDYLIRAMKHLVHDLGYRDVLCVVAGSGTALPTIKALAEELDLTEHITFKGWVEHAEVVRLLNESDICVAPEPSNPYNDRSTMIKMMEYMALGKPIVAFDLPEHRRTAHGAAVYAPPNDERAFAEEIARLIENPEQRQLMGQMGRERIDTKLAWRFQAEHLVRAYDGLTMQVGAGSEKKSVP